MIGIYSQPSAIAPEMPISTMAPATSPCSPAAVPSFAPSFSLTASGLPPRDH